MGYSTRVNFGFSLVTEMVSLRDKSHPLSPLLFTLPRSCPCSSPSYTGKCEINDFWPLLLSGSGQVKVGLSISPYPICLVGFVLFPFVILQGWASNPGLQSTLPLSCTPSLVLVLVLFDFFCHSGGCLFLTYVLLPEKEGLGWKQLGKDKGVQTGCDKVQKITHTYCSHKTAAPVMRNKETACKL